MKATELLEQQHRKVEAIFRKLEGGGGEAEALVRELANNVVAHMVIEQNIFYPAAKEVRSDLVLESYEEHSVAEFALKRLVATDPDDEHFEARVRTLKELIDHHVREEEEELFPSIEKEISEDELTSLAKKMKAKFDEVSGRGYLAALAKSKPSSGKKTKRGAGRNRRSSSSRASRASEARAS